MMQTSELYRHRAAECERMAAKHPEESDQLRHVAKTWRLLAQAEEDLTEAEQRLH